MTISGTFLIKNKKSGTYIDVNPPAGLAQGWQKEGDNVHRLWDVVPVANGGYAIKSNQTGKFLNASSDGDGSRIFTWFTPQVWDIKNHPNRDGCHTITLRDNGRVMDLWGGDKPNGTSVDLKTFTDVEQQAWVLEAA